MKNLESRLSQLEKKVPTSNILAVIRQPNETEEAAFSRVMKEKSVNLIDENTTTIYLDL